MDRRVTNRVNMFNVLKKLCNDNAAKVALIPKFVTLIASLGDRMVLVKDLMRRVLELHTVGDDVKKGLKVRLALLLNGICGAGQSYAEEIKSPVVYADFDYPESTLKDMRDTELIEVAAIILAHQATHATALAEYGISTTIVREAHDILERFDDINPAPVTNISTGEALRKELLLKTFETSAFIYENIMKAAKVYKVTDPNFYESLVSACRIRNAGLRHKKNPAEAVLKTLKKDMTAAEKQRLKAERLAQREAEQQQEIEELKQLMKEINANTKPNVTNGVAV